MKRVPLLIFLFAMCLAVSPPASAALLSDGNSTAQVDPTSQAGMWDWAVDGHHLLYQQWFWYRIGNTGPEASIDTISAPTINQAAPNTLTLDYANANITLTIEYTLLGGAPWSFTADIGESIRIGNPGTSPLNIHFFQYSDFDLRTNQDEVDIDPSLRFVTQQASAHDYFLSETTESPRPNHGEANTFAATRNSLNDPNPTTLNDQLSATGDVIWAFEWDTTIAGGGSFLISKDKLLSSVPEPAAIGLLGGVLVVVARKLRRRTA